MGAFHAVFEHKLPGCDPAAGMDGRALARPVDDVNRRCQRLGARDIWHFHHQSHEEDPSGESEGQPPDVREDLVDLRTVLVKAAEHGIQFRLLIDISL